MWPSRRWIPFFCFLASGVGTGAFFAWHAYHYNAECSMWQGWRESDQLPTGGWMLPVIIWLIPATATIAFGRNTYYAVACVLVCAVQSYFVGVTSWWQVETAATNGENCFREFASTEVVIMFIGVVGGGIVVAITIAIAVALLASMGLKRLVGLQRTGP